jgi:hypothetical protein
MSQDNQFIQLFVSRPNWVADEFRPGMDGFLSLLKSSGFRPRTIGASDRPLGAPLDEVIRLMDLCSAAVILGYPQVVVATGTIKGTTITEVLELPTEWNHIEASLAYAKRLPLLVISHEGMRRGIFDRGALGSFIYELNLTNPAWPLSAGLPEALDQLRDRAANVRVPDAKDAAILDDVGRLEGLYLRGSETCVTMKDAFLELQGIFAVGVTAAGLADYMGKRVGADVPSNVASTMLGQLVAWGLLRCERHAAGTVGQEDVFIVTSPRGEQLLRHLMNSAVPVKSTITLRTRD